MKKAGAAGYEACHSCSVCRQACAVLEAHAEKRVALVIGNAAYQNTQPLANPRNDASDLADAG